MRTTITYEFNGRDIEEKSRIIECSSVTKLIDSLLEISDDYARKPNYISIFERYVYFPSLKSIIYSRKVVTPRSNKITIRARISASLPTLRRAMRYFESSGVMHSL